MANTPLCTQFRRALSAFSVHTRIHAVGAKQKRPGCAAYNFSHFISMVVFALQSRSWFAKLNIKIMCAVVFIIAPAVFGRARCFKIITIIIFSVAAAATVHRKKSGLKIQLSWKVYGGADVMTMDGPTAGFNLKVLVNGDLSFIKLRTFYL